MDKRYSFNQNAERYNKVRPTYPKELYNTIITYTELKKDSRILEIGIGTGQATIAFLELGCTVEAVELGEDLAQYCKERFKEYPKFSVFTGEFEKAELDSTYDCIYSATAFHWIKESEGYPKLLELLKEKGCAALFWNVPYPAYDNIELYDEIQKLYAVIRPNSKPYKPNPGFHYTKTFESLKKYGFKDIQKQLFVSERILTSQEYILLLNTYSDHCALDEGQRIWFENSIKELIDKHGGKIKIKDTVELYLGKK